MQRSLEEVEAGWGEEAGAPDRPIEVKIPAGVNHGSRIRVAGKARINPAWTWRHPLK